MKSKRDLIYVVVIILLAGIAAQFYYTYRYQPARERDVGVYYNRDAELDKKITQLTRDADKFVYFAVYTFTKPDLKDALLAAKYRGLTVIGLTDKNQYESIDLQKDLIDELRKAGIPVYEQDHGGIMHMKVLVTDKAYASGSYNWTAAATNINDEVLEVGRDDTIRGQYQRVLEEAFGRYRGSY